jgi:hypothetical protein
MLANYYDAALYLGTGQNGSGFGCDDSTAPSRRVAVISCASMRMATIISNSFLLVMLTSGLRKKVTRNTNTRK